MKKFLPEKLQKTTSMDKFDSSHNPYPLPFGNKEQDRLKKQHDLFTVAFGSLFQMPITNELNSGIKVLDVGCGACSWSFAMAKKFPNSTFYAVDINEKAVDGLNLMPNMKFEVGNVLDRLPYPDNYFDVVNQRLLIAAIPKNKWTKAIKEINRVLKPGGFVEFVEFDINFQKMGDNYKKLHETGIIAMEANRLDMQISTSKLPTVLKNGGFTNISTTAAHCPIGWGSYHGLGHMENIRDNYQNILRPILQKMLQLNSKAYDELVSSALEECVANETFFEVHSVVGKKM
ncbi:hypothetical protein HK098_007103 [Nowakowskiella sp. JEL0407]|nr:hypothetical protein HK098_007103 [Nowakowskiella sp. JEL0407]